MTGAELLVGLVLRGTPRDLSPGDVSLFHCLWCSRPLGWKTGALLWRRRSLCVQPRSVGSGPPPAPTSREVTGCAAALSQGRKRQHPFRLTSRGFLKWRCAEQWRFGGNVTDYSKGKEDKRERGQDAPLDDGYRRVIRGDWKEALSAPLSRRSENGRLQCVCCLFPLRAGGCCALAALPSGGPPRGLHALHLVLQSASPGEAWPLATAGVISRSSEGERCPVE